MCSDYIGGLGDINGDMINPSIWAGPGRARRMLVSFSAYKNA